MKGIHFTITIIVTTLLLHSYITENQSETAPILTIQQEVLHTFI